MNVDIVVLLALHDCRKEQYTVGHYKDIQRCGNLLHFSTSKIGNELE